MASPLNILLFIEKMSSGADMARLWGSPCVEERPLETLWEGDDSLDHGEEDLTGARGLEQMLKWKV